MKLLVKLFLLLMLFSSPLYVQAEETSDQGSDSGQTSETGSKKTAPEEEEPEPECE